MSDPVCGMKKGSTSVNSPPAIRPSLMFYVRVKNHAAGANLHILLIAHSDYSRWTADVEMMIHTPFKTHKIWFLNL